MKKHWILMQFIGMICCSLTLVAVLLCSYNVTITIAKPLKTLIKFANLINSKVTEKNFLDDARKEVMNLPEVIELLKN